jgi:hypothetical protein
MRAHGLSQRHLESRIDLSQRLSEVAQVVRLTKLMLTVGQNGGDGWDQAPLFIAEHRQNRPLQAPQRR